jgi:hypothetical protein
METSISPLKFGEETIDHITLDVVNKCRAYSGAKRMDLLIKHIYFDPAVPRNRTVRVLENDNSVETWDGCSWVPRNRNDVILAMRGTIDQVLMNVYLTALNEKLAT